MFSRGGRGEENGLLSVVIGVIALLALLGNSKRARRHARRVSGSVAKGAGSMMLVWLIGGFLLFMGLMSLLSSIGGGAAAGLGFSFMFCLAPGAVLLFLGLAAHRARERSRAGRRRRALRPTPCSRHPPNRNSRRRVFQQDRRSDSRQSPRPRRRLRPHSAPPPSRSLSKPSASLLPILSRIRPTTANGRSATAGAFKASSRAAGAVHWPI